ncbi:uncharacterized protein LOC125947525 [Dermacentor silvarum]|uniref:uncharacterized protein LOC125947525 n=1 Tax=Dermacentor silvarum TaxID=543639 RepID=UPI002100E376|nr:uncharacterized protein LOC125947525 [Dermacentor silvarum]
MSKRPPTSDGQVIKAKEAADRRRPKRLRREDTVAQTTSASHAIGYESEIGPDPSTRTAQIERTTASPSRGRGTQSSDNRLHEQVPSAPVDTAHRSRRIRLPSKPSEKSKYQYSGPALDTTATSKAKLPKGADNARKKPGSVHDRQTTKQKGQAGQGGLRDRRANPPADAGGINPDQVQSATRADKVDELSTTQSYLATFYTPATTLATALAVLSGPEQQSQIVDRSPGAFCAMSAASTVKSASDQQGQSSTDHSANQEQTSPAPDVCRASSSGATSGEIEKQVSGSVSQGLKQPVAKALVEVPSIVSASH